MPTVGLDALTRFFAVGAGLVCAASPASLLAGVAIAVSVVVEWSAGTRLGGAVEVDAAATAGRGSDAG
jgi:hypothetical protein